MATTNNSGAGGNPPEPTKKAKRVEVICEGTLGPDLLKKGDKTDNPAYVALLETERGRTLVREVK